MVEKFKVAYTVKHVEKASVLYGLLIDRSNTFNNLQSAVKFAREIRGLTRNGVSVVGNPVVERA